MKLLLLSDLHFGYEDNASDLTKRETIMSALLETPELEMVDGVMFTGDISWKCSEKGYSLAQEWVSKLRTHLKPDAFLISCCGNHDVDRFESAQLSYCDDSKQVDEALRFEQLDILSRRFQRYIDFCEKNAFHTLNLNGKENYLVGVAQLGKISFWVFNSSWYALKAKEDDRGKLWLGRNFYHDMYSKPKSDLTICLMHHPKEWLINNELYEYQGEDKASIELIAKDCNLCFTGHTHGNSQEPTREYDHMLTFSTGAIYSALDHKSNFSIYDISDELTEISRSIYNCRDFQSWALQPIKNYSLKTQETVVKVKSEKKPPSSDDNKALTLVNTFDDIKLFYYSVKDSDLNTPRLLIWPVVPRDALNNIHLAQLELMRILCVEFNCSLYAIISNCGSKAKSPQVVIEFAKKVKKYCEYRGIKNIKLYMLDQYFEPTHTFASEILTSFVDLSKKITLPTLTKIKSKKYAESQIEGILKEPVLDHILPLLQMSVISTIANDLKRRKEPKPIIIAGNDEHEQWCEAVRNIGRDDVGAILIPELNIEDANVKQDSQDTETKRIIECKSKSELEESLAKGNLLPWLFKLFVILPNYENKEICQSYTDLPWKSLLALLDNSDELLKQLKKGQFIDVIWDSISRGIISNSEIGE